MTGGLGAVEAPRRAAVDEVARATAGGRWALRWRGWAAWSLTPWVLAVAGAAVVVDVTTAWTGTSLGTLGRVPLSPALPLAALLVVRLRPPRLGWSRRDGMAWRELGIGLGVILVLAAAAYAATVGRPAEAAGLIVAALGEELVFRLAAILVIGAIAAALLGRDWRHPERWGTAAGVIGLLGAAGVFTGLPGHVAQITGAATSVSFASLALVLGYTVLRTGAVWPAAMVHALLNLTTIAAWNQQGPAGLRLGIAAAALVALVAAADLAGRRLGRRVRVPTVVDLRAVHREPATP